MVAYLAERPSVYTLAKPSADIPPPPMPLIITPDSSFVQPSDYAAISERSSGRLRYVRPIIDGFAYQHASPGSRATVRTDATSLTFRVLYNALISGMGPREGTAIIMADDEIVGTISNPTGYTGPAYVNKAVNFLTAQLRTVTLVWPYADGMDLVGIDANPEAVFLAPPSRPSGILATCGDSITHGFSVPSVTDTWAFNLAAEKGRRLVNLANAGRTAVATDATALNGVGADRVTYLIGYNDFLYQNDPSDVQAAVEGWINTATDALPSAKIYVISPIYSPNTDTIPLSSYRTAVQSAVAAVGGANVAFVNGLDIMDHDDALLVDTIHPNAAGAAQIVASLAAIVAD